MDYDEGYIMREEARCEEEYQCTGCGKWITGYEAIDPIVIDDTPWCDCCASNLTHLRMSGEVSGVAEKVKPHKEAHDRMIDQLAWEQVYDDMKAGKVNMKELYKFNNQK